MEWLVITALVGFVHFGCTLSSTVLHTGITAIREGDHFIVTLTIDYDGDSLCSVSATKMEPWTNIVLYAQNHGSATFTTDEGDYIILIVCGVNPKQMFLTLNDTICSKPQEIDYGSVTYDGETAMYECDSGYTLEGNSNLTCNNGIWIPDPPTCIKNRCPRLLNVTNGSVAIVAGGILAIYRCNTGHTLRGQFYRICQNGAKWSGFSPTCEVIRTCNHPGVLENGKVDVSRGTEVGERVYYTCNEEFKMRGESFRTCQVDYTWSGVAPVCEACEAPHVQLYGGRHRCEGLLRINDLGYWATFCSRNFPEATKRVICRQLGCGDLIPGGTVDVQPPTKDYHINLYECTGNERSLCGCQTGRAFCDFENITSNTVDIQCEEGAGDTSEHIKDPVIELKGGPDRCDGQLLISGVYRGNYTQVIMCDREATLETANVVCRQLKCGPPVTSTPFSHTVRHIPPSQLVDTHNGFRCIGCETGLGFCNPIRPNCSTTNYILALKCAKPETALTNTGTCSPVTYTPRPIDYRNSFGVEYTCTPTQNLRLCPNIVDANGRCCKGLATPKAVSFNCVQKIGTGAPLPGYITMSDHAFCSFG